MVIVMKKREKLLRYGRRKIEGFEGVNSVGSLTKNNRMIDIN
jgi:hypothetical protein